MKHLSPDAESPTCAVAIATSRSCLASAQGLEEFFDDVSPCAHRHKAEPIRKLRKRKAAAGSGSPSLMDRVRHHGRSSVRARTFDRVVPRNSLPRYEKGTLCITS